MTKRRRPSLKRLYADLKDAPPNVASLEVSDAGFRVTFREVGAAAPTSTVTAAKAVALVPGTPFPDDGSPLNPIDLVFFPPGEAEGN